MVFSKWKREKATCSRGSRYPRKKESPISIFGNGNIKDTLRYR